MLLPKDFKNLPKSTDLVGELPATQAETYNSLTGMIQSRYQKAKLARQQNQESIWLASYRAWRGELSPEETASINAAKTRMGAASSVFIKITKAKTTAAYGQLCEILFANNKFPIGLEVPENPEGLDATVTITPAGVEYGDTVTDPYGYTGDGREIPAGATTNTLLSNLKSGFTKLLGNKGLSKGSSPDPKNMPEIHPAQIAASNLEKVMQTQLDIGKAHTILRKAAFEASLYGTGIIKGPFTYKDTCPYWKLEEDKTVTYNPQTKLVPKFSHVSVWNFYPDPDAESIEDCEYTIERHALSKTQLRNLKKLPKFNSKVIEELLTESPKYTTEFWEQQLGKNADSTSGAKYEVLEYWGSIDKEFFDTLGIKNPEGEDLNSVQVCIWICQDKILHISLNPFEPQNIPYHSGVYEEHPHRIWGIGVPENMSDTQMLMNGHMRMSIDNLRLAGNLVLEVNENQMVPGQDYTIFPGKVFRKQGGASGQSLYGIKFPDTSQSHIQMFDKARQLADEATGLPSYSHGQTGVSGTTRTASGMSMLMSASALNTKTVAANFDKLIESLGIAIFNWNMQFNTEDKNIRGNFKIVAKGTASLMQREVVTQRLLSLMQIGANPAVAPFLKMDEIIKEIVRNMDLDGEKFVNDPVTAKLFADAMAPTMGASASAPQSPPTGGVNPSDATGSGGGNIGFGSGQQQGQMQEPNTGAPT